jgi:hypothetical protein
VEGGRKGWRERGKRQGEGGLTMATVKDRKKQCPHGEEVKGTELWDISQLPHQASVKCLLLINT